MNNAFESIFLFGICTLFWLAHDNVFFQRLVSLCMLDLYHLGYFNFLSTALLFVVRDDLLAPCSISVDLEHTIDGKPDSHDDDKLEGVHVHEEKLSVTEFLLNS